MPDNNKISLSDAHAALDNLAVAQAVAAPNLLQQVMDNAAVRKVAEAYVNAPQIDAGSGYGSTGSPSMSSAQNIEVDLLTVVRTKLARVASEFGIPYATVRDFFTSHL